MCPKYPSVARRTPRLANEAKICRGSNTARGNRKGPSVVPNSATKPPINVSTEVPTITRRQSSPPSPFNKCGIAEPKVSPPTKVPSAVPRCRLNHVAIAFKLGGYTNARLAPVKNRTGNALGDPLQKSNAPLITAATHAPINISRRGRTKSARFSEAESKHPATNPSCTEIVIHAPTPADKCHNARSCGSTADAENHAPMLSTEDAANATRACHRPAGSVFICLVEFISVSTKAYRCTLRSVFHAAAVNCELSTVSCFQKTGHHNIPPDPNGCFVVRARHETMARSGNSVGIAVV